MVPLAAVRQLDPSHGPSPPTPLPLVDTYQTSVGFHDVHDTVVAYDEDRPRKRHNSKLPDPAMGFFTLCHALYAAATYWAVVTQVHALLDVPTAEFHRHYNLQGSQKELRRPRRELRRGGAPNYLTKTP
jgi:hypothetical protein